jgi:class 3 adenylate cyclase
MDCGQCGIDNPSGARFCMQCGAPLAARSTDPGPAPDDQRRQVTAMFCDLVGYTEIGQKLDPEELRALVAEFQRCCVSIVESHGGYVAQYLGDGVLVYFGYPVANEDDAVRAVRSALELRSALEERNAQGRSRGGPPLEARMGVHTGPVVISHVGSGSRREALAVGDTVNLAARLQSVAPPGGIAVSKATRRLVAGLFVTRDLGVHSLKGIAEGQQVHEVERASGVRHRFEAAGTLTPLVGRDRELGLLLDRWEKTCAGVGQVVLLSSDPGVGKSRVIHAFREKLRDESHTAIDGYCSQYTTGTAFHPITQLIEIGLGFEEDDSPHTRLEKLEGAFALPNLSAADLVPFLGPLLGVPASKLYPTPELSPERRRERTLEALVAMLRSLAVLQPLLVVFEDLHWSDPSTLEVLGRLIEEAPNARLMLLLTFRPSFEPPWNLAQRGASSLSLARLGRAETIALAESVAGGSKLPEDVLEQVLARADGVPLFVEELVRSVLDGGKLVERSGQWTAVGSTTEIEVPVSLQDSLMARLDRLSSAKNVAQICAALGREFPYELLESVAGLTPETLSAARRRPPATASSTRCSRTPRTNPCCDRPGRASTRASPRRSRRGKNRARSPRRRRGTTKRAGSRSRPPGTTCAPATARSIASPPSRRSTPTNEPCPTRRAPGLRLVSSPICTRASGERWPVPDDGPRQRSATCRLRARPAPRTRRPCFGRQPTTFCAAVVSTRESRRCAPWRERRASACPAAGCSRSSSSSGCACD